MNKFLLGIALSLLSTVPALCCSDGQHEQCGGICICVPDAISHVPDIPGVRVTPADAIPGVTVLGLAGAALGGDNELTKAAHNAKDFVNGFSDKSQEAIRKAINHPDKAVSDAAKNAVKAANDIIDAAKAAERYAERKIQSYPEILSDAEKRLREGKVVDAVWHLGTDEYRKDNANAAQLVHENELISTIAQSAAGFYGGPAGAASFAAWKAYNESHGDVDFASKLAYMLTSSARGMPTQTPYRAEPWVKLRRRLRQPVRYQGWQ